MYAGDTHSHLLLLPEYITKLQLALYQRYTYVHCHANTQCVCKTEWTACVRLTACMNEGDADT